MTAANIEIAGADLSRASLVKISEIAAALNVSRETAAAAMLEAYGVLIRESATALTAQPEVSLMTEKRQITERRARAGVVELKGAQSHV